MKLSWDELRTLLPQILSCHGNYSDTSVTALSLDVLSSYLARDFLGRLSISQINHCYGLGFCHVITAQLLSWCTFCDPAKVLLSKVGRFPVSI